MCIPIKITITVFCLSLISCASHIPKGAFQSPSLDKSPDYKNTYYWASLPFKTDPADQLPESVILDHISEEADVFFIHPTSYFGDKTHRAWNADINDPKVNKKTDNGAILFQASIFNSDARIFAPRYRQAHYNAFFTKDITSSQHAFDLAYEDVYNAFLYYYDNWNKGRPIIIAGHSQGAKMAVRLIKEVFDNKAMKNKLVVAYVVGIPVPVGTFEYLKVCKDEHETSCICSWRTFKSGTIPKDLITEKPVIITNPLSWTTDENFVDKKFNKGMVLDMKKKPVKNAVSAQIYKNILWCNKPKFKGSFLVNIKNFHKGDYNLYYLNVRENVRTRIRSYYKG